MRLTKYPQSCLLIEDADRGRVVVDLGTFATEAYDLGDLGPLDAVVYTHQHPDHLDRTVAAEVLDRGIPIYANADVCSLLGEGTTTVRDGQQLRIAGFTVVPHDLPHVPLVDGSPGPPNTGFLFDGRLFHPGDGIAVDGIRVDALAVPIVGPSISFRDAYVMVEKVGAATAIPIHHDYFLADPDLFAHFCDLAEVVVLDHGASADI